MLSKHLREALFQLTKLSDFHAPECSPKIKCPICTAIAEIQIVKQRLEKLEGGRK